MGKQRLKPLTSWSHLPLQHSRSVSHGSKVGRHQSSAAQEPSRQERPQQAESAPHGSPRGRQTVSTRHLPSAPHSEPQHSESEAQLSPATLHGSPLPWQIPEEQLLEQQMESELQLSPAARQPPPPLWQVPLQRLEQQSTAALQRAPVATQLPVAAQVGPAPPPDWHTRLQQSAAAVQLLCTPAQCRAATGSGTLGGSKWNRLLQPRRTIAHRNVAQSLRRRLTVAAPES